MANKTIPNLDELTEIAGTEKIPIDTGTQTFAITAENFRTSVNVDLQNNVDLLDSLISGLES